MIRQKPQATVHDPDETVDLHRLIEEVVPDPPSWTNTPNPVLDGKRPVDLIGTRQEPMLRDMLRAAKHGMIS